MKIRCRFQAEKITPQMAPMIDVVFQLLIFFMLTLRIVESEGDFNINMPAHIPSQMMTDAPVFPDIKVRLEAMPDGSLRMLYLGPNQLGNDRQAFQELNRQILTIIGKPGNPLTKDIEVEIDADYNLGFQHVISAVSACTGRLSKQGQVVRYVEKIKFAPPKRPAGGA